MEMAYKFKSFTISDMENLASWFTGKLWEDKLVFVYVFPHVLTHRKNINNICLVNRWLNLSIHPSNPFQFYKSYCPQSSLLFSIEVNLSSQPTRLWSALWQVEVHRPATLNVFATLLGLQGALSWSWPIQRSYWQVLANRCRANESIFTTNGTAM